jgi:uncharacterized membrane protein SpoIIM required for sporulation
MNDKASRVERTQLVTPPGDSTTFKLLRGLYQDKVPRTPQIFAVSLVFSLFAIIISLQFFARYAGMVSVFFAVLGLQPTFQILLDRHQAKVAEYAHKKRSAKEAHWRLLHNILTLFLGTWTAYSGYAVFLGREKLEEIFSPQVGSWLGLTRPHFALQDFDFIVLNNLGVALGIFVVTLLYRLGGALLVLAWNASVWGILFVYFAEAQSGGTDFVLGTYLLCLVFVLPHILFEAMAYISAVLAGILLLRSIVRADERKNKEPRLGKIILGLIGITILCTVIGALLEISLAPMFLSFLA